MKRFNRLVLLTSLVACGGVAHAQLGWGNSCIDPANTQPRTADHAARTIANNFIIHSVGTSGSVTYGGESGPCYAPARTLELAGRLGFQIGPVGSIQSNFDNFMALTTGMPRDPAGDFCYAQIIRGPAAGPLTTVLFGSGGLGGQFVGLSQRYMITNWSDADTSVELESRVIGDAVRLRWRMTNLGADSAQLGLKFGAYVGMRSNGADQFGQDQAGSLLGSGATPKPTAIPGADGDINRNGYVSFIETDTTKPVRTGKNWLRSNPRFPSTVNVQWGQWNPYGIRFDNDPTDSTSDATAVSQMLIGTHGYLGGLGGILFGNNMRGRVVTDFAPGDPALDPTITNVREDSDTPISETSVIQVFPAVTVFPGGQRDVIQYIRSPWSVGDYLDPYTVLVDAPRIIEPSDSGLNGLSPNPMTIAAYIDNQYAIVDQSVPLVDVRFTIEFPAGSSLSLAPGETTAKVLSSVSPNAIGTVSWQVQADGNQVGALPFKVKIAPANSATKEINSKVLVAATPRIRIPEGAILVTFPWNFADSSLDSVLDPLNFGVDYLAYKWDPNTGQYLPQVSARRGESVWIVALNDFAFQTLNGATTPTDINSGGQSTTLQPGWNMIGNPYPFPVRLSQLVAVGLSDPSGTLTWDQLLANGWVSPSLAYWDRDPSDPTSGFYRFTEGSTDFMQPNKGYWIFVTTPQRIQITWPPVFLAGVSNTTRRPGEAAAAPVWRQSDKQWRLQIVARTEAGIDSQNFVGVTTNASNAKALRKYDPPTSPNSKVDLSFEEMIDGRSARLASSFSDSTARRTWKVMAHADKAGEVVLTWPNITTVPRNMRFTLKDVATNTTRDLRFQSSYAFTVDGPTTREFQLTMEPAGVQRALIGNVTVARPSRDVNGPVVINYTLSTEAMTTITVRSANGKEVYRFHRGRADVIGENSVTWALRDSANRAVAPGTYQIEILAETSNGDRVRKIVPINVVR